MRPASLLRASTRSHAHTSRKPLLPLPCQLHSTPFLLLRSPAPLLPLARCIATHPFLRAEAAPATPPPAELDPKKILPRIKNHPAPGLLFDKSIEKWTKYHVSPLVKKPPPERRIRVHHPVPEPRYGITVADFLNKIGKDCGKHVDKFTSWEDLFTAKGPELKKRGIEVKQRKWILRWVEKYRQGIEPFAIRMKSIAKKNKAIRNAMRAKHQANVKKGLERKEAAKQERMKLIEEEIKRAEELQKQIEAGEIPEMLKQEIEKIKEIHAKNAHPTPQFRTEADLAPRQQEMLQKRRDQKQKERIQRERELLLAQRASKKKAAEARKTAGPGAGGDKKK